MDILVELRKQQKTLQWYILYGYFVKMWHFTAIFHLSNAVAQFSNNYLCERMWRKLHILVWYYCNACCFQSINRKNTGWYRCFHYFVILLTPHLSLQTRHHILKKQKISIKGHYRQHILPKSCIFSFYEIVREQCPKNDFLESTGVALVITWKVCHHQPMSATTDFLVD